MQKNILFISFLIIKNFAFSQTINIDSLRKVLQNQNADSVSIRAMLVSGQKMANSNYEAKLSIYNWAITQSEKNNYTPGIVMGYRLIGLLHMNTYNNTEATENMLKAIQIAEKNGLFRLQAQALDGLAGIYRNARSFEKSIEYQRKSIAVQEKTNELIGLGALYYNLAGSIHDSVHYSRTGHNNKLVLNYIRKGIKIAEDAKDTLTLLQVLNGAASIYAESGIYDTASLCLSKTEGLIKKMNVPRFYSSYYLYKGNLFRFQKEFTKAIDNYLTGLEIAKKNKDPFYEKIYSGALSKSYAELKDSASAYSYFVLYSNLSDSLDQVDKLKVTSIIDGRFQKEKKDNEINRLSAEQRIRQLEIEKQKAIIAGNLLEARKKEAEINLLSQEKELQELRLVQQNEELESNTLRAKADSQQILLANQDKILKEKQLSTQLTVRNYLITGLGISGLLSFFLFRNIRAKNKAYTLLENKSIQIKEQALQLSRQAKLIAQFQSQMNPHFVYNALHNIQGLVLSQETQKANTQIQSLAQLMRKTFSNAEKDDIPLEEEISYLQKYIEFERTAFDNNLFFEINVDTKAQNALIPPMMIQPFVENAIKHAGLKKIENPYIKVLIEIENNLLSISIKDNGMGIKKNIIEPDKLSHSVSVIKSRLNLLFNGKVDVANKPVFSIKTFPEIKEGTAVKFYLPLQFAY